MIKKYFIFCLLLPIVLLSLLNLIFFKTDVLIFIKIILWLYLFLTLGYVLNPITRLIIKNNDFSLVGAWRVLFLVIFTYFAWLIPHFHLAFFSPFFLWYLFATILLVVVVIAFFMNRCNWDRLIIIPINFKELLINDSLFLYSFLFFILLHSFYPDSNWGEKTMDLSLLNYLIRRDYHPIFDNWSPSVVMKYYYWGYYLYAAFLKMLGIPGGIGFTVVAATLPALMINALYGMLRWIMKRRMIAVWGAIFLVFSSNLASVYLNLIQTEKNRFWFSTRVFDDNMFAEFPVWSFVFKDLHPHVFAYPITITLLFLFFLLRDSSIKSKLSSLITIHLFIAMLWGGLIGYNGWDFLIYSFLMLALLLMDKQNYQSFRPFILWGCTFLLMFILHYPMLTILKTGTPLQCGLVTGVMNNLSHYYLYLGNWINLLIGLITFLFILKKKKEFTLNFWLCLPSLCLILFVIAVIMKIPISSILVVATIFMMFFLLFFIGSIEFKSLEIVLAFELFLVSLLTILLCEHFYFMDRLNTIFKVMNNVWIWMGLCGIILVRLPLRIFKRRLKRKLRCFLISIIGIPSAIGMMGTCFLIKNYYVLNIQPSLDPQSTFLFQDKDAYHATKWINENIKGTPIVLEAVGMEAFDPSTLRISKFTGLPSFTGWPNHIMLRGTPYSVAVRKVHEAATIYQTMDITTAYELLRKSAVDYIYVGQTEKQRYGDTGMKKFFERTDYFELVYKHEDSFLFKLKP